MLKMEANFGEYRYELPRFKALTMAICKDLKQEIEPILVAHHHRLRILEHLSNNSQDGVFSGKRIFVWERAFGHVAHDQRQSQILTILSFFWKRLE